PVPAAEQVRSESDEAPARDRARASIEPLPTPARLDALTSLRESASRSAPSPAPKSSPTSFDLERLIGGKTFAVLGALAVVVAAGLFLKLAYDQGWLGRIPDAWKCGLSALFGGALLALGEVALRRWGRAASIGLTSAGLGVVYMSAYAAYGMY